MALAQRKAGSPVCTASRMVPVTVTPTGNVKLHHVSEKGIFFRMVRMVSDAASTAQSMAKPHTGTPKGIAKMLMPTASCEETAKCACAPSIPAAVID